MLGSAKDNIDNLISAINYIENSEKYVGVLDNKKNKTAGLIDFWNFTLSNEDERFDQKKERERFDKATNNRFKKRRTK